MIKAIFSLRIAIIVCLAVYWFVLLGIAVNLNGGMGAVTEPDAFIAIGFDFLGVGLVLFGIAFIPFIQKHAIAENRVHWFKRTPFGFIGISLLIIASLILLPQIR